jgi:uncharacterized protein (TIGR02246 family)
MRNISSILVAFSIFGIGPAMAANSAPIQEMVNNYLAAWSRSDAESLGSVYAIDGEFVSPAGDRFEGSKAVAAFYQAAFARGYSGRRATATIDEARDIGAGIVLARGVWAIEGAKTSERTFPKECGAFDMIAKKKSNHSKVWQVAFLQEHATTCPE